MKEAQPEMQGIKKVKDKLEGQGQQISQAVVNEEKTVRLEEETI